MSVDEAIAGAGDSPVESQASGSARRSLSTCRGTRTGGYGRMSCRMRTCMIFCLCSALRNACRSLVSQSLTLSPSPLPLTGGPCSLSFSLPLFFCLFLLLSHTVRLSPLSPRFIPLLPPSLLCSLPLTAFPKLASFSSSPFTLPV